MNGYSLSTQDLLQAAEVAQEQAAAFGQLSQDFAKQATI